MPGHGPWPEDGAWTPERYEAWVQSVAGVDGDAWRDRRWAARYRAISEEVVARPGGRGATTTRSDDDAEVAIRALIFGQRTVLVLSGLMEPGWAEGRVVVDAGAGSGPVALVALAAGAARVESLEVGRGEGRWLRRARDASPRPEGWVSRQVALDPRALDPALGDTWVFGYSFLELSGARRAATLSGLKGLLEAGRRVIILEAGTRSAAHALAEIRDALPDDVRRPCRGARVCPRGAEGPNWCHFTWKRSMGSAATRVLQAAGRRPNLLHFSFLDLATGGARSEGHRLLEVRRRGRRSRVLHFCGSAGESELEVQPKPREVWTWAEAREAGELLGGPEVELGAGDAGVRRLARPLTVLGSIRST